MKRYIAHLRTKHDSHKKRVAFGVSASITALIAIVWVTSFSYFNGADSVEIAKTNRQNSPLSVIRRNIAGVYEAITGSKVESSKDSDSSGEEPELEYVPTPADTVPPVQ